MLDEVLGRVLDRVIEHHAEHRPKRPGRKERVGMARIGLALCGEALREDGPAVRSRDATFATGAALLEVAECESVEEEAWALVGDPRPGSSAARRFRVLQSLMNARRQAYAALTKANELPLSEPEFGRRDEAIRHALRPGSGLPIGERDRERLARALLASRPEFGRRDASATARTLATAVLERPRKTAAPGDRGSAS